MKAVDPLGFQYKIQDYLTAFGVISWFPSFFPLLGGIILSAIEFSIGIFLFFGIKKTISTTLALVLMIFDDTADAVSAIFDPVSDCGCFGDAWLTNWETFAKNIVLLLAAIATFQWRKMLIRFVTRKDGMADFLCTRYFLCIYTVVLLSGPSACAGLPSLQDRKEYHERHEYIPKERNRVYMRASVFILEKERGKERVYTRQLSGQHMDVFVDTRTIVEKKRIRASDSRLLHDGYEHG